MPAVAGSDGRHRQLFVILAGFGRARTQEATLAGQHGTGARSNPTPHSGGVEAVTLPRSSGQSHGDRSLDGRMRIVPVKREILECVVKYRHGFALDRQARWRARFATKLLVDDIIG